MSKSVTIGNRRLMLWERKVALLLDAEPVTERRPLVRGDCIEAPRPCPWVSCRYHLALDVHPKTGSLKLNFPGVELEDMPDTCALNVADRHGADGPAIAHHQGEGPILDTAARALNLSRESVRKIQESALVNLRRFVR